MTILTVVGARPNFMKAAPIIAAVAKHNKRALRGGPGVAAGTIRHILVHTGQHYDDRMSGSFFTDLELSQPDIYLGVGSGSHIVTEYLFRELAKIRAVHVPYRGGAPAVQAAVGNQVDVIATSFGAAPQINDGKLNGLAVATAERWSAAPQVPTYIEGGFPDLVAESWVGFFVPAKTDPRIVQKLGAAITEIVFEPDVAKHFTGLGLNLSKRSAAETAQYVKAEVDKWGKMVRAIGVTAGN